MTAITRILKQLPGLKTAADFASASAALEAEKTKLAADVAALKAKREQTIFNGGKLEPVERDIVAAQDAARTLDVALDGASKRRTQATEAERMAELEAVAAGAGKLNAKLRAELVAFASVAETLAGHAETVTSLRREIAGRNTELRTAGRGDLAVDDPITSLPELVGRIIYDPVKNLVIPELWPHRHPDGPALAMLKK